MTALAPRPRNWRPPATDRNRCKAVRSWTAPSDWGPSFDVFRRATAHTQIAASTQISCRTQSAAISTVVARFRLQQEHESALCRALTGKTSNDSGFAVTVRKAGTRKRFLIVAPSGPFLQVFTVETDYLKRRTTSPRETTWRPCSGCKKTIAG